MGVGGQRHVPTALAPPPQGKRHGNHCIGGWVGPRAGLDGCGKSHHHRDSIPGPPIPYRVVIPTELSWSSLAVRTRRKINSGIYRGRNVHRKIIWLLAHTVRCGTQNRGGGRRGTRGIRRTRLRRGRRRKKSEIQHRSHYSCIRKRFFG